MGKVKELLTNEEMKAFKKWLGEEGVRYFRHLVGLKGTPIPILKLNREHKGMPCHCVHFREGMQIRNWLRENANFAKDIDSIQLDDCYVKILEEAIK